MNQKRTATLNRVRFKAMLYGDDEMTHTSINHCKNSNYQIDHGGTRHNAIANFEDWCLKNEVIWAHLFDERTGQQVATFNGTQGLTTLAV